MKKPNFSISTPHDRASIVSYATCACALLYHVCVLFMFLKLKIYPMFFFNFASVSIFTSLLISVPKLKNYLGIYFVAMAEVVVHQILAEYFMGSDTCFHFFIFVMGLLSFLIFEDKYKFAIPVCSILSLIYILMENIKTFPKYYFDPVFITVIHGINVTITILEIIFMISIYTIFAVKIEKRLKTQNERLGRELKLASNIQQNFFYQNTEGIKEWDIGYVNFPMASVSGDMFDIYRTGSKLDGFGIFDVSGHGISSGLVTMLVKNIIHQEFYEDADLELWETLLLINDKVTAEKGDIENYLTGILAKVKDNQVEIVNASHPCPIIYRRATNTIEIMERPAKAMGAIGLADFPTFYESQFVNLDKGDEILLYTDGVTDCLNEENEEYGVGRLVEAFLNVIGHSAYHQCELLLDDIVGFRGEKDANDDITFMIVKK